MEASGRRHDIAASDKLDPENVAYQGRVLVSVIALIPACIWTLTNKRIDPVSDQAFEVLTKWFERLIEHAGLQRNGKFIPKGEFGTKGFLGSGGIGRFRETLWAAALSNKKISGRSTAGKSKLAEENKARVLSELQNVSR